MADAKFGSILIRNIKCSNYCIFCGRSFPSNLDLSRDDEIKLMKDTMYFIENNFQEIDVSGSEPLQYSKILDYLRWIRPKFKIINLLDPCNKLSDESFAKELLDIELDKIFIPVYGSTRDIHNLCTGNDNAFDGLLKTFENVRKFRDDTQTTILATSLFMRQNISDMTNIIRFLNSEKIPLVRITVPKILKPGTSIDDSVPDYGSIRKEILKMSSVLDHPLHLGLVPPCILEKEELYGLKNISFSNVHFTYNLSGSESKMKKFSDDYRTQLYGDFCNSCYLKETGICGGILRHYFNIHKDFRFHPISKETYMDNIEKFNKK